MPHAAPGPFPVPGKSHPSLWQWSWSLQRQDHTSMVGPRPLVSCPRDASVTCAAETRQESKSPQSLFDFKPGGGAAGGQLTGAAGVRVKRIDLGPACWDPVRALPRAPCRDWGNSLPLPFPASFPVGCSFTSYVWLQRRPSMTEGLRTELALWKVSVWMQAWSSW